MNLAMNIKFSKEVRAALREFSKVDRREYIEKAVAKQLAKDAQEPLVISRGTVEFHGGGSESPRVTTLTPVEGTVPFSYSCSSGSGSGFVGVGFAGGGGSWVTSGSPVSDSGLGYDSGSGFGSSSGGNSSNELLPFQQEMQKAIEQGYKVSIRHRDQIPPSEVLYRSPGSVGNVPNSSGGGSIVIDEYDAEQKESEPVSESPRLIDPGSGHGYSGGGGASRLTSRLDGSGAGGNASLCN